MNEKCLEILYYRLYTLQDKFNLKCSIHYNKDNKPQKLPIFLLTNDLLPFYAILRSIPNKLLGVIAMFSSLIIILLLPKADLGLTKGLQFRPISKIMFYTFVINFLILMQLGAKHVESPYIELGQVSTILYFSYFLVIVPVSSIIENTLIEVERRSSREKK